MFSARFAKGHALGNDYLVLERGALGRPLSAADVRALCLRQHGVGGDGVIEVVDRPATGHAEVVVWNADGTTAEVSGNGLRIAALALEYGRSDPWHFTIASAGHSYPVTRRGDGRIEIRLEPARIGTPLETIEVGHRRVRLTAVDVGNPHAVLEASEVGEADWPELSATIERHPRFPARTNVERIELKGGDRIAIRIHERGVGPTAASGTGAMAAASAAVALALVPEGRIQVEMPGGEAEVEVSARALVLCGPVELSFTGELAPDLLARLIGR